MDSLLPQNNEDVLALSKPLYITSRDSKTKQKILEEEEYLEILDNIVERDFYPELTRLKLRTEYIDALDNNDVEKLRRIQIELDKSTPFHNRKRTPRTFEPTAENDEEGNESIENRQKQINQDLTLDQFLFKNTSEDNASFEKIMELTREKHREKHAWLFEKQLELENKHIKSLTLPSSNEEQLLALENKSNNLDTWKYVPRNALMYTPDGVELSADELIQSKGKKEQQICHENTRFQRDPFDSFASQNALMKVASDAANMKRAVGKIGVDGKVEEVDTTPNVSGYSFVATPSPAPGVDASPLMTWGEIEGTPLRLDATPSSSQGPTFKIPEPPRREQIAHLLAEKASKQHREKRRKAFAAATKAFLSPKNSPRIGSLTSSERLHKLSPAAQNLVKTSARLPTGDKSLRASYTPSPSHSNIKSPFTPSSKTPTPSSKSIKTPDSERTQWSLTDNLLQLPKV